MNELIKKKRKKTLWDIACLPPSPEAARALPLPCMLYFYYICMNHYTTDHITLHVFTFYINGIIMVDFFL